MSGRQYRVGDSFTFGDAQMYRVAAGRKAPGDLVLQTRTLAGWEVMAAGALLVAHSFLVENEDYVYAPPRYLGGKYVKAAELSAESDIYGALRNLDEQTRWKRGNDGRG